MNPAMSPVARAHDIGKESPVRRAHRQLLVWQHDESQLRLTRLDPAHALLRSRFPKAWQRLIRVQALLDATTVLDLPATLVPDGQHIDHIAPLLRAAAQELAHCADEEDAPSAHLAAAWLAAYASSGQWQPVTPPPGLDTGRPWVYAGPGPAAAGMEDAGLSGRHARIPLCLIVAAPHAELQAEADDATARLDDLRRAAESVLGDEVVALAPESGRPGIAAADLLLAGGTTLSGHWDLTPLASPYPTAVFVNVRRHRVRQVLAGATEHPSGTVEALLGRSLRRSIGHVAAHHWRRASVPGDGEPAPGLKSFERLAFEEAYAVLLPSLAAHVSTGTSEPLREAVEELTPYAGLPCQHAADTAAALLVIGRLRQGSSAWDRPLDLEPAAGLRPVLETLVRSLHAALWEADAFALAEVRAAFASGARHQARRAAQDPRPPVEFGWTFG
ncbi:hypothetical protein ACGF7W_26245 [Streptomyces sp. NPDC048219]|uniref:hypothetical protein n=1 Tax=Streptomyces sp. NPDC048219 TaxID=3365517 RepID=UPI00371A3E69